MLFAAALLIADPAVAAPPPHTYLKGAEARRPCGEVGGEEIVVCGSVEGERLRSPDATGVATTKPLRAEAGLGGGKTLSAHNGSANVGGFISNRALVTLSVPLR